MQRRNPKSCLQMLTNASRRKQLILFLLCISFVTLLGNYFQITPFHYTPHDFRTIHATHNETELKSITLQKYCASTKWQKDVYLDCYALTMGVFNGLNKLQVCMRWALDAGIGMIRPKFLMRGENLSDLWNFTMPYQNLSFVLDEDFLWRSLKVNCPSFQTKEYSDFKTTSYINITGNNYHWGLQFGPGEYRNFTKYKLGEHPVEDGVVRVIKERDCLAGWKLPLDPTALQIAYRDLYRFNPTLVAISDAILKTLPYQFIGGHLRMEEDFPVRNFEDDMVEYAYKHRTKNTVLYVACGDEKLLQEITLKAAEKGILVKHKWSTVSEPIISQMRALKFDQLAIVDYMVLARSTYFVGVTTSSFSYALAVDRHVAQFGNLRYKNPDNQQYVIDVGGEFFMDRLW